MKIAALTDLCCNRTRPLTRLVSAIPPPARLRADAPPPHQPSPGGQPRGLPLQMQRRGQPRGVPTQMVRGEGAFPRRSPQHLRPKTPKTSAGHNRLIPPQGQFAEKQPPRRRSRCLSWSASRHRGRIWLIVSLYNFVIPHKSLQQAGLPVAYWVFRAALMRHAPTTSSPLSTLYSSWRLTVLQQCAGITRSLSPTRTPLNGSR